MVKDLVEDNNTNDVNGEHQSPTWEKSTDKRAQNT